MTIVITYSVNPGSQAVIHTSIVTKYLNMVKSIILWESHFLREK